MHDHSIVGRRPLVFGEVLFDCFEDGSRILGGAPFNVSWHLQAFGMAPMLMSRVGMDLNGQEIMDSMRRWGMDTSGMQHDDNHPTGKVNVTLNNGQPDFEIADFSAWDYMELELPVDFIPSLIYHGTLALRHENSARALDAILQRHAAPVFIDVNLRPPWWQREPTLELLSRASLVKINEPELELLCEESGNLHDSAMRMLERYDLDRIIVTRGERGGFTLDRRGDSHHIAPAESVAVVDAVGAGDAFAAVCILGFERDWPTDTVMRRAQEFASLLVARRGATIGDIEVYRNLLAQWL